MATFKSVLSRWIVLVVVLCGCFLSTGAVFAPPSVSFQGPLNPMPLGPSVVEKFFFDSMGTKPASSCNAALNRLGSLVITERAIGKSA
ncbi:MAG: hypothetical protein WCJ71_06170 [Candidatus Omnitrophota bacterium]